MVTVACAYNILIVFLSPLYWVSPLSIFHISSRTALSFFHLISLACSSFRWSPRSKPSPSPTRSSKPSHRTSPLTTPILFVSVGILRFWLDLVGEHGVVFVGVYFGKSWRRLRSTFVVTAEEDQPSEPTEVTRRWTTWWTAWWTSASSELKSDGLCGGGLGLWERERELFWGRWVSVLSDWVCERKAVRERIIKNCKRMNILLNKCVE